LDGAVACKIQVGDYSKTSSDQWNRVVPLASANKFVKGKKWYKQAPLNKLTKSQYRTMWWNEDVFGLKTTDMERRKGFYKIQQCEVEIVLDKSVLPDTTLVNLQVGARVYQNNDATTFKAVPEKDFDWYRSQMKYGPALEVAPTYEAGTEKVAAGPVQEKVVDLSSAFADRIAAAGLSANVPAPNANLELLPQSRVSVMPQSRVSLPTPTLEAPSIKAGISATQTVQ
jgi:hypothetical protein